MSQQFYNTYTLSFDSENNLFYWKCRRTGSYLFEKNNKPHKQKELNFSKCSDFFRCVK